MKFYGPSPEICDAWKKPIRKPFEKVTFQGRVVKLRECIWTMSPYLWFCGICWGNVWLSFLFFWMVGYMATNFWAFLGFFPQHQVVQNEVPSTAMYHSSNSFDRYVYGGNSFSGNYKKNCKLVSMLIFVNMYIKYTIWTNWYLWSYGHSHSYGTTIIFWSPFVKSPGRSQPWLLPP